MKLQEKSSNKEGSKSKRRWCILICYDSEVIGGELKYIFIYSVPLGEIIAERYVAQSPDIALAER